ncbi:MAG TPA: glycosyltransferase [Acidimicrobiaceae bacterium]|nr:glycosyltransferase [Acidimicrobiaceae bacterium]
MQLARRLQSVLARYLNPGGDPRIGQGVLALQVLSLERWLAAAGDDAPSRPVSIVTATRDRPALLRRAAASVVGQRYRDWQWIVVNDGAPGSCDAVLSPHSSDPRITLVEAGGVGLAAARNQGLEVATGEFVTYLDDDNRIHYGWLGALAFAVERAPATVWGYGARIVETPEVVRHEELAGFPYLELPIFDPERLRRHGNYIDANTLFHRNGEWRFDERTRSQSDWELILQLTSEADPLRVPAVACLYSTAHPGRMSRGANRADDVPVIRAKHGLH